MLNFYPAPTHSHIRYITYGAFDLESSISAKNKKWERKKKIPHIELTMINNHQKICTILFILLNVSDEVKLSLWNF